jgi:3-hydroxyacyl-CoA dehydrogenase/enoyl-CoA hydratase/3-hydroxybutyryl-CoA epimerase
MTTDNTTIRWDQGADGVVVLTFDDPNQSANTMNAACRASLVAAVDRLEDERDRITGVIVTSAKKTFFAGGDLNELRIARRERADEFAAGIAEIKRCFRRLETLGRPVVAAINGSALGGGLELALATHHRVALDDPSIQIGFPEVQLGLLPGGGGVVRSVRLLGIVPALTKLLLAGPRIDPAGAHELGLIDELVPAANDLVPAARAWIAANPDAAQPWDVDGHAIPGGTPSDPHFASQLPALPANLRKQLKGANYPAPRHIMAAAVEGAQVDIDSALEIEERYFVDLATGQIAKNMIQASFFDLQRVKGERGRGRAGIDFEPFRPRRAVVLGAGMMGAGIAYACAKAGIAVALKDVSLEAAERGKSHSQTLVARDVEGHRMTPENGESLLGLITPIVDPAGAEGAELVVEAVFEDPAVKGRAFAEIQPYLADEALIASNTSTLPISELAEHVSRRADFIGLHFFSPVDRMPLLEIIKGDETSDATLGRALDIARLLNKTPIVVNDSRGFFTSRVIMSFIDEGIAMLLEGIPAPTIEQASLQAGYPAPVLQLSDELNLNLIRKIRETTRAAIEREGGTVDEHPAANVIGTMLDVHARAGRLAGAGFYEYVEGRRERLWPGLSKAFGVVDEPSLIPLQDLVERMLFIESLEAVKCLEEGVIESVADANVGSLLGIGFPAWTGGVLQYINGYDGGPSGFVARCRELASSYGQRFEPSVSLVDLAERGGSYSDVQDLVATGY